MFKAIREETVPCAVAAVGDSRKTGIKKRPLVKLIAMI
uniref:Uncharacterized protein n=1 Tax=Pseudomonas fluorescens (strain SBW25) TaxID=216595 RepID=A0A0G4E5G6_PSEFS|nr:hypothetical protein PQBR55_0066 [Pseudomonas fluorescens SBW25]